MPRAEPASAGRRKTLLITAVGSGVGRSVLQSLHGRRERLRVVGLNSRADAPENFQCDAAWQVPETAQQEAHRRRLWEVLEVEQPDLVVPGRDEDIGALAALAEQRPDWAPQLLVGSVAAARVVSHKMRSAEFAAAHGLPFAPTVCTDAPDAQDAAWRLQQHHGFPLIAKPAAGNGSRGVRVLLEPAQLQRLLVQPGLVLQPMFDAPAELQPDLSDGVPFFWGVPEQRLFALRGWVARDGAVHPGCAYVMTMVMGRFERMARIAHAGLAELNERYGHALASVGWRGPFHLQCKQTPQGEPMPIEINGRLGGGTAGRRLLGYDEVVEVFNHWLGGEVVPPDTPAAPAGGVVISRPDDCLLPAGPMAHLEATGHWQA